MQHITGTDRLQCSIQSLEQQIAADNPVSVCLIMISKKIFGTIKRKWGFSYTDLRGLKKVNGEVALIMTVYNLKRVINILGIETLLKKLKTWKPKYPRLSFFVKNRHIKCFYTHDIFSLRKIAA